MKKTEENQWKLMEETKKTSEKERDMKKTIENQWNLRKKQRIKKERKGKTCENREKGRRKDKK